MLVVDDGCTDDTAAEVARWQRVEGLNLRGLRSIGRQGRCLARNRGLESAQGALTVFLDGDALPGPNLLEMYWDAFCANDAPTVLSGHQHHLPELEYAADPRTGSVTTGCEIPSVVKDLLVQRREEVVVTEAQVRSDFEAIRHRARPGSYPNDGTIRRQEEARGLLQERPNSTAGWLAFIPHNGAVATSLLRSAGGFDADIAFSEGWELAYRLQRYYGAVVRAVEADTYHLYHHHDFGDPSQVQARHAAVEYMAAKHRDPRIRLVYFWYAHLWADSFIPDEAVVKDLIEFDRLYQELPDTAWQQYEAVLRHHPNQFPLRNVEVNYESCA